MATVTEDQRAVAPPPQAHLVPHASPTLLPPPPPPPPPLLPPPTTQRAAACRHRCKVCGKGFVCGRALGGHMRAHGVTDGGDDGDGDGDGDSSSGPCAPEEAGCAAPAPAKRMYALRANPGRLRSCRVCENCGKEFTPWKSLLDHGRCTFDAAEEGDMDEADDEAGEGEDLALAAGGWSKGKRTRRAKVHAVLGNSSNGGSPGDEQQLPAPSSEEGDLANCLVMLSSSSRVAQQQLVIIDVDHDSYTSASKEDRGNGFLEPPPPISIVAAGPAAVPPQLKLLPPPQVIQQAVAATVPRGLFECKACKKVFTSHQALGGHRASHKKVKGCFAARLESNRGSEPSSQPAVAASPGDSVKVIATNAAIPEIIAAADPNTTATVVNARAEGNAAASAGSDGFVMVMAPPPTEMQAEEVPVPSTALKKNGKVHECSICHRVFMSGQALGGHKRCHWLTAGAGDPAAKLQPFVTQDHVVRAMCQQLTLGRPMFDVPDSFLDLNVATTNPPPAAARQQAAAAAELNDSVFSLNTPASLCMHSWTGHESNTSNPNKTATSGHYDAAKAAATEEEDDEADSGASAKRAKISDLRDLNVAGETSAWLGIALPSESNGETTHQLKET